MGASYSSTLPNKADDDDDLEKTVNVPSRIQEELEIREETKQEETGDELNESEEEKLERDDTNILFISTHGLINCSNDDEIDYIRIPEGMQVIKITLSLQGNVNMVSEGTYDFALVVINSLKSKMLSINNDISTEGINEAIGHIKDLQLDLSKSTLKTLNKELKKSNYNKKIKKKYERQYAFVHGMKDSVKNFTLNEGDLIANKTFLRDSSDISNKIGDQDYSITIVNSPDKTDVLSEMTRTTRYGSQRITMEQLLNYFKNKGIVKLIIFDYSCSVYKKRKYVEERSTRNIRRKSSHAYGGKRTKKVIKRNKKK